MQRIPAIDDDPAVTGLLKRGLSYAGYGVAAAGSGDAGLSLAREPPRSVVVLDIRMPEVDGLEGLRRAYARDTRLPVIMLTAKDASSDQVQGLETGADDYVFKPFSFEVLLARVHALLGDARPTPCRFCTSPN